MNAGQVHQFQAALGTETKCIETHISWVVLAGGFAYKIKKPVTFSFLDFSTRAQRLQGCREECRLNRRLAPTTYLGVVALRWAGDQIVPSEDLAEGPDLVDFAVKMLRLDEDREMDKMLAAGRLTDRDFRVLAQKIAAFHQQATRILLPSQGDPDACQRDFNDILQHAGTFGQVLGQPARLRLLAVVAISDDFLHHEAQRNLIRSRVQDGFVRDLHGDLHTRNIFAYPDPVVFDCIEFNDHFRQIDVLSEVAFLCMDLEEQGHDEFSTTFLSAYVEAFPAAMPPESAPLLDWFKLYRANVRAKVNALQWPQSSNPPETAREMAAYLALMERYAARLNGAGAV